MFAQPPPVLARDRPSNAPGTPGAGGRARNLRRAAQYAARVPADHAPAPSLVHRYRSFVPVGRADGVQKDRSMDENSVFAALAALISTQFSVPEDEIRPETRLADLALDSIGLVELAALLEDEFDVDVTATTVTMQDRIGDLVRRLCDEPRPSAAP
jgi:acyl carrier protein